MRKTKIVATLGPSSCEIEVIKQLIEAGLDAARINFSHGTYESHGEVIAKLKEAREALNAPIPLLLDTKGPEIRTKALSTDSVFLTQGSTFTLTTDDIVGDEKKVAVTYADLPKDVTVGERILIDDGLLELVVKRIKGKDVICEVINNGTLGANKGVNIPDVYVNLPSMTEKDIQDIKFGIEQGFDYIAASFIRSANDVLAIRDVLERNGGEAIRIIAKIESREGVENIDAILEVADGIMVARGDLGVEIPPEEVPIVQKHLIEKANLKGKPVITATQMLESMVTNPRPTRAEANDVANAIFDGTDAIMLSGETAKGKYPVESVSMMARIAQAAEGSVLYREELAERHEEFQTNITNAVSYAACTTAADLNAACIATVTDQGFTARMISRFRPQCPILAITPLDERVWRQLNLTWGCVPTMTKNIKGSDEVFDEAVKKTMETNLASEGDAVVIAAGVPIGIAGTTNTLRVVIVGDVIARGKGYSGQIVGGVANVIKVSEIADKYFRPGDILVTTQTTNEMIPYIRKAAALVVGAWEKIDNTHAETVARALDKPLIVCEQRVVDLLSDGMPITVDTVNGFVYNGIRGNSIEE